MWLKAQDTEHMLLEHEQNMGRRINEIHGQLHGKLKIQAFDTNIHKTSDNVSLQARNGKTGLKLLLFPGVGRKIS